MSPRAAASVLALALLATSAPWLAAPASAGTGFPQCSVDVDVLFVFDTTGSMGGVIGSAKSGALSIMANVNTAVPGTRFGVAEFKDYPGVDWPGYGTEGGFGDYPWALRQDLTGDSTAVQNGINPLFASGGGDEPESQVRAMYESQFVGWRPAAIKIVVLFTDARAHDTDFNGQNTGGDPGRDGVPLTADDLDFQAVAAQMAANGVQEIGISVGAGGGAPYLQYAAQVTHGAFATLGGDFVQQVTDLILSLAPRPSDDGLAVGVRAELSVPANPVLQVAPVRAPPGSGTFTQAERFLDQPLAALDGFVHGVDDGTTGTLQPGAVQAVSNSTVSEVSLLGGLVYARGLHSVASSVTLPSGSTTSTAGTRFDVLRVNGVDLSQDIAPNTIVPLAGVGTLILNEVKTAGVPGKSSEVVVTSLHLLLDTAQARGEVVLGRAYAGTSCAPPLGGVLRTFDNDAGSGGDAPADPAQALPLTSPALVQGRLVGSDTGDAYRVHAGIGEKVEAVLVPSARAAVDLHHLPATPGVSPALPSFGLTLREPGDFAARVVSPPGSLPGRTELNVDVTGDWVLDVSKSGLTDGNYTLAVVVAPILLGNENDANLGHDAPDACGAQDPALGTGQYTGVLRDADHDDFFTVHANIGDAVALVLKPTEDADGANFDLYVYDAACNLVASSTLGSALAKGLPDEVTMLPAAASSDYRVQVHRVNGIGDWYLTIAVQDPMPTLAPLDAEAGGDAGGDAGSALALTPPAVVQGRLPDGDQQDWYKFTVTAADKHIVAVLDPQALSGMSLTVLRPDGAVAASSALPSGLPQQAVVTVTMPGTWYVQVGKLSGGGDYLLGLATLQE